MVQKVSTTFVDHTTKTINNTLYNEYTRTFSTMSTIDRDELILPNNVTFNVDHEITVKGNVVISNGSIMKLNEKMDVKGTLIIEKMGTLITAGKNLTFGNLIVDGKMEVNGKFTTQNDSLITVKGEMKINGTFGTIQESSFALKKGGKLEINTDVNPFEDNRKATFTIEEDTLYIVNENKIIEPGTSFKKFNYVNETFWNYIPLGKMNLAKSILSAVTTKDTERIHSFKGSNMRSCIFENSSSKTYPKIVESKDPAKTPILTPSMYCISFAKAKFPTKRLIVKPMPVKIDTA